MTDRDFADVQVHRVRIAFHATAAADAHGRAMRRPVHGWQCEQMDPRLLDTPCVLRIGLAARKGGRGLGRKLTLSAAARPTRPAAFRPCGYGRGTQSTR